LKSCCPTIHNICLLNNDEAIKLFRKHAPQGASTRLRQWRCLRLVVSTLLLKVLIQKALITVSYGMFDMHDLVQEMGHYIVRGEHSNNPLKHSRVWKVDDVRRICDADTKMELDKIEAIRYANNDTLPSHVDASMTNLRSVELNHLCGSSLPTYLLTRELRCLNLWRCEHRQLWEGYKVRLLVSLINE
ncbi:hypothetical protein Tco_0513494, partial [Tanacetum coccineum]